MRGSRLSLLLALSACTAYAEDQPKEKPANDQPDETIAALVGDYCWGGDGLCMNCRLMVMPGGRFSYTWRGCLGIYGENEGTAKLIDGHLIPETGAVQQRRADYLNSVEVVEVEPKTSVVEVDAATT